MLRHFTISCLVNKRLLLKFLLPEFDMEVKLDVNCINAARSQRSPVVEVCILTRYPQVVAKGTDQYICIRLDSKESFYYVL